METQLLTEQEVARACSFLKKGEIVGMPTETVYGLAANGLNPEAVQRIFQAKGRPQDNPLILHIPSASWLPRYCEHIPKEAWLLAEHFWPGPLTMVLEAKHTVPSVVRANLPTVGLRCPQHPLALALIEACDFPIAAPSGNVSGKPSPTTAAAMLEDMQGKIPAILQGGPCQVGVESTIISLGEEITLLRAGGVPVEEMEALLGKEILRCKAEEVEKPLAPGMKYRHYAPQAPVTVVCGENSAAWIAKEAAPTDGIICFAEYASLFSGFPTQIIGKEADYHAQAQQVFSALRYFDDTSVKKIWAQSPREEGLGLAVANRLHKASGFQLVYLEDVT